MSSFISAKAVLNMFSFQHSSHSRIDRAMSLGECDSGTGDQWVTIVLCDIFSLFLLSFLSIILMIEFSSRTDAIEGNHVLLDEAIMPPLLQR
jgi:hypothetical protein